MRGAQIYRPALIDDSIGTCESASSEQDDSFVGMRMVDWTQLGNLNGAGADPTEHELRNLNSVGVDPTKRRGSGTRIVAARVMDLSSIAAQVCEWLSTTVRAHNLPEA
ncbi:hypothetical protein BHE74_00027452 [Ensete ventricosum]|nr:hypothetical protein BHE74_00027452 [Ensete ventricosum]